MDSFMKLCELHQDSDHDTCYWRTSQRSLFGDWERFSGRWPRSGMMRNGTAYLLPPLPARPTSETGFSYWLTPTATEIYPSSDRREKRAAYRKSIGRKDVPGCLSEQVSHREFWPTPRASEYKDCGPLGSKSYRHMLGRRYLCAKAQEAENTSGKLNPRFVEWLMGFPQGWTELNESKD